MQLKLATPLFFENEKLYKFHRLFLSCAQFILLLFATLCFAPTLEAKSHDVLIYIRDDVYEDYLEFVNQRDVLTIDNFIGSTIRRDVVDMIIAQQALKLGGFNKTFKYAPGKVNFRNTKMLQNGQLLISFDSYWQTDATTMQDELYISQPVIRNGEYIAGIYTNPNNAKTLAVKTIQDLQALTAVSTPKWRTDWQTLQVLGLKELVREDEWLSMARMVDMQWIDFMLMPFNSTSDKSFTLEKITLVPVPNVAVVLNDSRHFVISKNHPDGKEAFTAINKGLSILRAQGRIVTAYTQAGFFKDKENKNLTLINENKN